MAFWVAAIGMCWIWSDVIRSVACGYGGVPGKGFLGDKDQAEVHKYAQADPYHSGTATTPTDDGGGSDASK